MNQLTWVNENNGKSLQESKGIHLLKFSEWGNQRWAGDMFHPYRT
jgi:hypothetical protein